MKTAREFAEEAANRVRGLSPESYDRIAEDMLSPIFREALDQTLQWQDGPPKERECYVCEYDSGLIVYRKNTMHAPEVVRHFGPIPDPPKKPEPLCRRFECVRDGMKGEGVRLCNSQVNIRWEGNIVVYIYDVSELDNRNIHITKWLD